MREILFRGKRKDNGEWVEGGYYREDYTDYVYITFWNSFGLGFMDSCQADPETVGQYTGMNDKNGKRIFEGDICRVGDFLYKVEFKHSSWWFTILSNEVYCCPAFNSHCGEHCEVVGTIHDDPAGGAL